MTRTFSEIVPQSVRAAAMAVSVNPGPTARATFHVNDPATGDVVGEVLDGDASDATSAVNSAASAFPHWASAAPRARSEVLRRAYEIMIADVETLAGLIALENGKSLADARSEVVYAAEFFRWFAEEAARPNGTYGEAPAGGTRAIVASKPVGIAALVTPWNFPAAMATRKIAPALAAGCTAVLKPAAETPLTALAIADVLRAAGLPDGVLSIVSTTDPGAVVSAWLQDVRVRKLSFTGSTGVGRNLLAQAAARVVSSSMELGGNAPLVVGRDADLETAVAGALVAKFRNGGQACTAANRLYVHSDVAAEFTSRFGAAVEALTVGHAFAPGTDVGPLISHRAVAGVRDWVDRALDSGAYVSHEGAAPSAGGSFFAPTVLCGLASDATVLQEEIFGPVAPIIVWDDEEALLDAVNGTEFGLAAYVFSRDLRWALQFSERVEAGMVGINRGVVSDPSAPFGGVKQSGLGREGAREGMDAYAETQFISVDWPVRAG